MIRKILTLALLAVAAFSVTTVSAADVRTWNDDTGKFSAAAKLISADWQEVKLERTNGKVVTVPISRLSDADRRFVERHLRLQVISALDSISGLLSDGDDQEEMSAEARAAWSFARVLVKERLKSPRSADFPLTPDSWVKLGASRWRFSAYVDARNAFNAEVRTRFECEVEISSKEAKLIRFSRR